MTRFKDRLATQAAVKQLQPERVIVAVVCESASGPGWANAPLYIIYRDRDGKLHEECVQPEDQTIGMKILYGPAMAMHGSLVREVIRSRKEYSR